MSLSTAPSKPTAAPPKNHLLAALRPSEYEALRPHLKPVLLTLSQILYNEGDLVADVYFVNAGIVSHVLTAHTGQDVEVGIVGFEGMVGLEAMLVGGRLMSRAIVQLDGKALKLPASIFREQFQRGGNLQQVVLSYQQAMLGQRSQGALCNALHNVEEHLSRWLLMSHDRVAGDEIEMTQEFIATMLASRRSGVTVAAGILRSAGLIDYKRGCVKILDRAGLEEAACPCYRVIHEQEQHWLTQP